MRLHGLRLLESDNGLTVILSFVLFGIVGSKLDTSYYSVELNLQELGGGIHFYCMSCLGILTNNNIILACILAFTV